MAQPRATRALEGEHVELDDVDAESGSRTERVERVLRRDGRRATVADDERPVVAAAEIDHRSVHRRARPRSWRSEVSAHAEQALNLLDDQHAEREAGDDENQDDQPEAQPCPALLAMALETRAATGSMQPIRLLDGLRIERRRALGLPGRDICLHSRSPTIDHGQSLEACWSPRRPHLPGGTKNDRPAPT